MAEKLPTLALRRDGRRGSFPVGLISVDSNALAIQLFDRSRVAYIHSLLDFLHAGADARIVCLLLLFGVIADLGGSVRIHFDGFFNDGR